MPSPEALPAAYQPAAYSTDPSTLERLRFRPTNGAAGPWPAVVLIPATEFKGGDVYGDRGERQAEKDLMAAGYLVFAVDHRLAPPGQITNQPPHTDDNNGRPPEQSNDIKQQILAAHNDSECNHTVFVIGGSSGGTNAFWAALDPIATVPGWDTEVMPKAVVGLSGNYDLSSRLGDNQRNLMLFIAIVLNYTNTMDDDAGRAFQYSVSPISLLAGAGSIPPSRLFTTIGDPVPHQQTDLMAAALQAKGASYAAVTIPNSNQHA
jgi:acetyl esterase/lipase